jgi:alkylation response protein AidB-like acyl-CoA dehydrogenase
MPDGISEQERVFLDRARSLEPDILAARAEMDRDRCFPAPLVQRLRDTEMFHLWLPRSIGGPQLHPVDFIAVVEELSRAASWRCRRHSPYAQG